MCNVPDVLSPEHLLSKELIRKIPFHPQIAVFCMFMHALVSGIWYKILAYWAQIVGY